jgi:hypothetical protein
VRISENTSGMSDLLAKLRAEILRRMFHPRVFIVYEVDKDTVQTQCFWRGCIIKMPLMSKVIS